ncbi:MAG: class I SAM-dependent methyltransferase [Myxococcales bacterium]|nr:class I SAM-dependent methyltransferase [Myxococcales bacterium]
MTRDDDNNPERRRARAEDAKSSGDNSAKERLFSLGQDDSSVPLAAVFKTRRPRGERQTPPPPPERPLPPPPPANPARPRPPSRSSTCSTTTPSRSTKASTSSSPTTSASPPPRRPAHRQGRPPPPRRGATLADVIPPDADPVWAREAVLAFAAERAAERKRPNGMWYQEFFGVDYVKSEVPPSAEQIRGEVDFIETALALPTAGRVLDLGCGYGRHTVPLARRGYDMVGLDLSLDLLQNALRRAQAKNATIKFVHGDIRDLEFDQVFDGVYCFNTTFGYFGDAENLLVLRGIHRALKPGGRLLIDIANRDSAIRSMPVRNWWEGDGCLIQEDVDFDHLTSRLMVKRFIVYADGTQREYDIALRLFSVHELLAMLRLVGFRYVDLSGSIHTPGAFFGVGSERILLTVER